ncbi:MAG TPA: hypothetical protein VFV23_05925 [Verrucomicrobiae bacterium]|nr:hypothetical protein [Verrucomicrobiae bacterium]
MNLAELQKKLIAAARMNVPTDKVPYAFEKRVTALLQSRVAPHNLELWVRGLWRAAMSCVAISLLVGVVTVLSYAPGVNASDDLSQNFVTTLLASVDQSDQTQP